jgi:hypothetical protein
LTLTTDFVFALIAAYVAASFGVRYVLRRRGMTVLKSGLMWDAGAVLFLVLIALLIK